MGNNQTAYDDAKNDEKIYNEQLNEQKAKTHYELNEEDKQKLKKAYCKASQICHPDRVNDEQKDIAQAVFVQLTKAYEENDLKKVEEILADLQKGVFKARSESVSQSDKLKVIKNQLTQKLTDIQSIIDTIKQSQSYQTIIGIDDWDSYFETQKTELSKQKVLLQNELNDK